MSSVKIASVLTRNGSDTIIATAPDFWETLTDFIEELCKINKKQVKKSDFEILTVADFIKIEKRLCEICREKRKQNGR